MCFLNTMFSSNLEILQHLPNYNKKHFLLTNAFLQSLKMYFKLLLTFLILFFTCFAEEEMEIEYVDYEYIETRHLQNEEDFEEDIDTRGLSNPLYQPNLDKYWPEKYYLYTESIQLFVPEEDKNLYWPPRDLNGKTFKTLPDGSGTPSAIEEWNKLVKSKNDDYESHANKLESTLDKFGVRKEEQVLARSYPYCVVDGKLPRYRLPDPFKYREENNGAYPFSNTDQHLERFIPFFRASSLRTGLPIVASYAEGKLTIPLTHVENGETMPSYIQGIYFTEIKGPAVNGIGVDHLKHWFHILIQSRVPLEGIYVQAIGFPMGLPFGQFRTDFECDMGKNLPNGITKIERVTDQNPQQFKEYQKGINKPIGGKNYLLRKSQELTLPCKYHHMDGVSGEYPNVFVYGGSIPSDLDDEGDDEYAIKWPPKTQFRMHFSYENEHCGAILRMQFLILAVKTFANLKHEQFLTPNYISPQHQTDGSGVPFPFSPTWNENHGGMKCPFLKKEENLVQVVDIDIDEGEALSSQFPELKNRPLLIYSPSTSWVPIMFHGGYDNCIVASGIEEDFMIRRSRTNSKHAPKLSDGSPDPSYTPSDLREMGLRKSGLKPYDYCDEDGADALCRKRSMMYICPPAGHICLNGHHPFGAGTMQRRGLDKFFYAHRTIKHLPSCKIAKCIHPKHTQPVEVEETGKNLADVEPHVPSPQGGKVTKVTMAKEPEIKKNRYGEDECENSEIECTEGSLKGVLLSEELTKQFYRAKGTHTWMMFLAWMTLMGIGTITARHKIGELNEDTKNGIYGMGLWLWFHILLFLASLLFLWVGLLNDLNIRRTPVPCNAYAIYHSQDGQLLKDSCRYSRQVVRVHRVMGFLATVLYHISLLVAWVRPMGTVFIKERAVNLRNIGIWSHILLAYLSKLVCICSVLMFFFPRAVSVCVDIPLWVIITQGIALILFVCSCVLQLLENKQYDANGVPVSEAVDNGKCYGCKVCLIIVVVLIHLAVFAVVAWSTNLVYGKSSRPKPTDNGTEGQQGGFDTLSGIFPGIFSDTCKVPSLASEEDIKMERYYRSSDFRDS